MQNQAPEAPFMPAPHCLSAEPFVACMEREVLWVSWTHSMTVTNEEAVSLTERVEVLCPDRCPPMLVELNAMVSLSRAALKTFATRLNVAAMALVGPSVVDQTLAEFFIRVHEPPYPTGYFTTAREARDWLTKRPHGE